MKWFHKQSDRDAHPITLQEIKEATDRVHSKLQITSLSRSANLSELLKRDVFLKFDNKFKTGSFKERGAVNFLLRNHKQIKAKGVCAASAGNHALALSRHAPELGVDCTIVMPNSAPLVKVQSTKAFGAKVHLVGESFNDAYSFALNLAETEGMRFVPAFDDPSIICGQGSAGIEILEQLDSFDALVVPVGGGGYLSGIACALKESGRKIHVLGVQSEWATKEGGMDSENKSPFRPVTIADGIAVKGIGDLTGLILGRYVDEMVTVTESEIADAIVTFLRQERIVVEGACAAGLAAVLAGKLNPKFKRVLFMIGGSNIDVQVLARLIERDMSKQSQISRMMVSLPDQPGSLATVTKLISEQGANVLETFHDRSFSLAPGNVDITFLLELKGEEHHKELLSELNRWGITVQEL